MDDLSFYVNCVPSFLYVDDNCQISYGSIVLLEMTDNLSRAAFPKVFFFTRFPNRFRKIPTDPHILAHVNKDRPNYRYPELEIYISELIFDSYQYITVAHVTVHCMI